MYPREREEEREQSTIEKKLDDHKNVFNFPHETFLEKKEDERTLFSQ